MMWEVLDQGIIPNKELLQLMELDESYDTDTKYGRLSHGCYPIG